MSEIIRSVWQYDVQVLPVTLAMLLVLIPDAIRRRQKFYYVPIYFSVFPLRELNADLAHYLGEDYFLGGESDEEAAESLRRKIVVTSVLSVTLSALLIPLFAGFIAAFFLTRELALQFAFVFVAYKSFGILRAIREFPRHAVGTKRNTAFLAFIYVAYLGVASRMILKAHAFARPFIEVGDWLGLFASTSDVVFTRVVAEFLLLALITTAFATFVMDRRIRRENLQHLRRRDG